MPENRSEDRVHQPISGCRLCQEPALLTILNLGEQTFAGRFPGPEEPDPPTAPLELVRCTGCGLVQLRHTVRPEELFGHYFYRSSVSETMRDHLRQLADEACRMWGDRDGEAVAPRVLDIGGNDGYLLDVIPVATGQRVLIDPSDVPVAYPGIHKIQGFFPDDLIHNRMYDLVFTVACFYDTNDPVAFARAVKRVLNPGGLWVVEVADLAAILENVLVDGVVHEHLLYLSPFTMARVAQSAGLKVVRTEANGCNGGSRRYYLAHRQESAFDRHPDRPAWQEGVGQAWSAGLALAANPDAYTTFAGQVSQAARDLVNYLETARRAGKTVHALGASTKLGAFLQLCGVDRRLIQAASDRDPRKVGRRMPGLLIPVVSEEESRLARPDVYVSVLTMFESEIVAREKAAGSAAELVFPLPRLRIVPLGA